MIIDQQQAGIRWSMMFLARPKWQRASWVFLQFNLEGKSMSKMKKLTAGGLLVAMGVVYGDIGTSPLYVMKAIVEDNGGLKTLSTDFVLGSVSLVFGL